jgi:hypothetical protein
MGLEEGLGAVLPTREASVACGMWRWRCGQLRMWGRAARQKVVHEEQRGVEPRLGRKGRARAQRKIRQCRQRTVPRACIRRACYMHPPWQVWNALVCVLCVDYRGRGHLLNFGHDSLRVCASFPKPGPYSHSSLGPCALPFPFTHPRAPSRTSRTQFCRHRGTPLCYPDHSDVLSSHRYHPTFSRNLSDLLLHCFQYPDRLLADPCIVCMNPLLHIYRHFIHACALARPHVHPPPPPACTHSALCGKPQSALGLLGSLGPAAGGVGGGIGAKLDVQSQRALLR